MATRTKRKIATRAKPKKPARPKAKVRKLLSRRPAARKPTAKPKPSARAKPKPRPKPAPKAARRPKPATSPAPARSEQPAASPQPAAPAPDLGQRIGVVTHYYSRLGVAIVKLETGVLRVGDTVHVKGHTTDFKQVVESLQIEHAPVNEVAAGQEFGLKVKEHAREHDVVYRPV